MKRVVRVAGLVVWYLIIFGLGVFGGFAALYLIGIPVAVAVPLVPTHLARHWGRGRSTIVVYSAAVALAGWWPGVWYHVFYRGHLEATGQDLVLALIVMTVAAATAAMTMFAGVHRIPAESEHLG